MPSIELKTSACSLDGVFSFDVMVAKLGGGLWLCSVLCLLLSVTMSISFGLLWAVVVSLLIVVAIIGEAVEEVDGELV